MGSGVWGEPSQGPPGEKLSLDRSGVKTMKGIRTLCSELLPSPSKPGALNPTPSAAVVAVGVVVVVGGLVVECHGFEDEALL